MGKNLVQIGIVTAVVVLVALPVIAQRKMISEKEWLAAIRKHGLADTSGRITGQRIESLVETIKNGVVVESDSVVMESLSPNRWRKVVKVRKADKVTETEQIGIGGTGYQREDGGAWHNLRPPPPETDQLTTIDPLSSKCNQYSVEPGSLDGKPMRVYEQFAVDEVNSELFFLQVRDWIGEDGNLYRTEKVLGKLFPREETLRAFTTFIYNPVGLRIEAPIK